MIPEIYGRLIVLREGEGKVYNGKKIRTLVCKCSCGKLKEIVRSSLRSGLTKSCGCLQREKIIKISTKHGLATNGISPTYRRWYQMIERCHNPKDMSYSYYGGRGIKVCKRWRNSVLNFLEDMGEKPKNKTLDRIDNNGPYSKKNCRWATYKQQQDNKRPPKNTAYFTFNGETKTIKEWAKMKGIKYGTLFNRINFYKIKDERVFNKESIAHSSKRINYANRKEK